MKRYMFEVRAEVFARFQRAACDLGLSHNELLEAMPDAAERGIRDANARDAMRRRSEAS